MSRTELLKKIKKIEIASSILANELFTGNYRSYFKGNGMEFSDIRRYSPGDDVKKIDWNVSTLDDVGQVAALVTLFGYTRDEISSKAKWYMRRETWTALTLLKDKDGRLQLIVL